jgi:hypothetical protein
MQALLKLQHGQSDNPPEALFLRHLRASCLAQQTADAEYHIHWSRHLLALHVFMKTQVLNCTSAPERSRTIHISLSLPPRLQEIDG